MEKKDTLASLLYEREIVESIVEENDGEMSAETEMVLSSLGDMITTKTDNIAFVLKMLENKEDFFSEQGKAMLNISKRMKRFRDRLKDLVKYTLEKNGVKEISGTSYRFTLQKTKPTLEIDEDKLSSIYWKEVVRREPDRAMIEHTLKNNPDMIIDGVTLKDNVALYLRTGGGK